MSANRYEKTPSKVAE